MGRVLDGSYNPIITSRGQEIEIRTTGTMAESFVNTTFINNTAMNTKFEFDAFRKLKRGLTDSPNLDYDKFVRIWPMFYKKTGSMLVEMKGGVSLTSSGDHSENVVGISGGATYYFDTDFNPSVRISDINNFSIGIFITSNDDAGTDFGCDDLTNFWGIQSRNSGSCTMWAGSGAGASFSNTNAIGHYTLNVRGGTMYCYKDFSMETSQAVSGSLPNLDAYIGGNNNNGSPGDLSAKNIGFVWTYNGLLSQEGVGQITGIVRRWCITTNKNNGEIT